MAGDFTRLVLENAANPRPWLEAMLIGAFCYFNAAGEPSHSYRDLGSSVCSARRGVHVLGLRVVPHSPRA